LCNKGEKDPGDLQEKEAALAVVAGQLGVEARVLPTKSVGVKADLRVYENPVVVGADASWDKLTEMAVKICADVPGINRCVWYAGARLPDSFVALDATVTKERLALLRMVDYSVMAGLVRHGIYDDIWQCPTVLVPVQFGDSKGELVVIRPVKSARAMTAQAAGLPGQLIEELKHEILKLGGVSAMALDITSKPPGTIEWE